MRKTFFSFALILCFISFLWYPIYAQEELNTAFEPFEFEASYIGDNVNNLSGGIETGSSYLGLANIRVNYNTGKGGLWKGGTLFINAANTHGAMPSSELLGDIQIASNIEAGNHTFLQELFFRQAIKKLEFTLGLQDLNVEFANSENAAFLLNSSFGILPLISGNIAAPIFPLTTLGFTIKWNITETTSWLYAVYDGSPTDFEYNPYNLNWQFNSGDGILLISEYQINTHVKELTGTYKIGFYSHNHLIEESLEKPMPDSTKNSAYGFYAYADQKTKSLGAFVQMGFSPSKNITNNLYVGMGLNYTGLLSKQGRDEIGLAFAQEYFTNELKSETVIELSYQYQITRNIFLQPDIQYIIHPAGTGETLDNCLAAIIRFGFSF